MARTAIVAGTGFRNRDGSSRAKLIRKYCRKGASVMLAREPDNPHDKNAIAVMLEVRKFLLVKQLKQIGYIKAGTAKHLSKRLDAGESVQARVTYLKAPPDREVPRVTIELL